ncbi:hypothetical protein IRJ34_09515 [Paenarthrobacter sp. GOM3]|uniref:hypothetical protein n=1 Tax=Paenarthrobacter sp. GOM3 TaxID=2782567 RepID=UPI001BACADD1|nr:hypothetical protein [Paenarthrobacter sp. GOM3]WOH20536.1 hypothetical protein IRJ34_09515 [Paenarthrobacter sp. GOM3]
MTDSHIPGFLDRCVNIDETNASGLNITALYGRYVSWALTEKHTPMPISDFSTALRHHGLRHDDDPGRVQFYPGAQMAGTAT